MTSDGSQNLIPYLAFSSDGHVVRWAHEGHDGGVVTETLTVTWENEAWTASGVGGPEQVHYVVRISPTWHVRQFLLFRDMEDPDLWLGTDGNGRWGEMNGSHRPELDGCVDLDLTCTPFTTSLPIRRLPLHIGHSAEITVASIDPETLDVRPLHQRFTRLESHRWRVESLETARCDDFEVDEFGLVRDQPTRLRRLD